MTTGPSTTSLGSVELSAGISSLSSMEREPLNSRIPLPIDLPSSGRRFGPKTIRAITRTTAISSGPTLGSTETVLSLVISRPGGLSPGSGSVCGRCQLPDDGEERVRLPDEQPVLRECAG